MSEDSGYYRLSIPQGTGRTLRVPVARPNGSPLDLDGGEAQWFFGRHSRAGSDDQLFSKTGTIDTFDQDGQTFYRVSTELFAGDTEDLKPRTYWYECWVKPEGASSPFRVAWGPFVVEPTIGSAAGGL